MSWANTIKTHLHNDTFFGLSLGTKNQTTYLWWSNFAFHVSSFFGIRNQTLVHLIRKTSVSRRNTRIKELIFFSQLLWVSNHFKLNSLSDYEEGKYLLIFAKCSSYSGFSDRPQYIACKSVWKCIFTDNLGL